MSEPAIPEPEPAMSDPAIAEPEPAIAEPTIAEPEPVLSAGFVSFFLQPVVARASANNVIAIRMR
jgi:hypothetical protein